MVSTDDKQEVLNGLFKEPIFDPKIQDGGHLSNRRISTKNHLILMKFGTQQQICKSMTVT